MLQYTLKRLLWMVPTLLVISLFAFGLSQCTPGDPVAEKLGGAETKSSSKDPLQAADQYAADYRRVAAQLGTDQPLFYISIHGSSTPDTLHRILPQSEQLATRRLIARFGNWPALQAYRTQLYRTTRRVLALSGTHKTEPVLEARRWLQGMAIQHEPARLIAALDSAKQYMPQDSLLQATLSDDLQALSAELTNLSGNTTRWAHYIPVVRWNGRHNQYHTWVSKVLSGDLGTSLVTSQEVGDKIQKALRWTLQLNLSAILIAYLLAIPLGVYAAMYAGSRFDRWLTMVLFFVYALPSFWVAGLLSQFLASPDWLHWFPSMGVGEVSAQAAWWEVLGVRVHHFFLPVFCMTYVSLAYITRQVRTSMVGILQSDFIRTARAKGLPQRTILWRHALPNALFPLITLFGGILPRAVAGSVIIELIFNIPGIGNLTIASIFAKDWPVVYTLLLLTAVMTTIGILLADLLYAWADPRIQLSNTKNNAHG